MADPRRIAPARSSAQHPSDDIGDVLGAIRRLIAEDEALVSARDRLKAAPSRHLAEVPSDPEARDPAEALARRYGGNAALARQLAHLHDDLDLPRQGTDDEWPLGRLANAPEAARPVLAAVPDAETGGAAAFERVLAGIEAAGAGDDDDFPEPRNDLARRLSVSLAGQADGPEDADETAPLRLDADRMIAEPAAPEPEAAPPAWSPLVLAPPPAAPAVDFDADFDWKARMRPEPEDLPAAAPPAEACTAGKIAPEIAAAATLDAAAIALAEGGEAEALTEPSIDAAAQGAMVADDAQPLAEPAGAFVDIAPTEAPTPASPFMSMPLAGAQMPLPAAEIPAGLADDAPPAPGMAEEVLPAAEIPAGPAEDVPPTSEMTEEAPSAAEKPAAENPADILCDEEQGIREMLREIIREELVGELGQRFSRNLRAVIRREVAVAIDDNLDRL